MNTFAVDVNVKHRKDKRTGKIVEIKETDGRARVKWGSCGSRPGMRTWVRFKDLEIVPLEPAEVEELINQGDILIEEGNFNLAKEKYTLAMEKSTNDSIRATLKEAITHL